MSIIGKYLARKGFVNHDEMQTQIAKTRTEVTEQFEKTRQQELQKAYQTGAVKSLRMWQAGESTRLTQSWTMYGRPLESDMIQGHVAIRARARERCQNDDLAKSFIRDCRENIVGPNGFKFQSNVKELTKNAAGDWKLTADTVANDKIEAIFNDFKKSRVCSIDGRMSLRAIEDLVTIYLARDGEAFVRVRFMPGARYGILLQVVEPELIDTWLNRFVSNGNVIKMGVEVDENRKPVNYYIRKVNQNSELFGYNLASWGDWDIIPAATDNPQPDQMLHIYDQEYSNQTRGISWLAQSMYRMKLLNDWEIANLVAAQVAADTPYFITPGEGSGTGIVQNIEKETDKNGDRTVKAEPGVGQYLEPGDKVDQLKAEFPAASTEMIITAESHLISAGVGDSYASLTNDLSNTSFSSGRMGVMKQTKSWKCRQNLISEQFLDPMFPLLLHGAIMAGKLNLPSAKVDKFNAPLWTGDTPKWSVNPLQDATAKALEIDRGITTLTQAIIESGEDPEEIFRELVREKKNLQDICEEEGVDPNLIFAPMLPKVTPGAASLIETGATGTDNNPDDTAPAGRVPPAPPANEPTKQSATKIRGGGINTMDLALSLIDSEGNGNGNSRKH